MMSCIVPCLATRRPSRFPTVQRSFAVLVVAMVVIAVKQSATALLRMVLHLMASRDERPSVQTIMFLLVSSSGKVQASLIAVSST